MEKESALDRKSNWELLRVLSMLVIILNHVVSLSGVLDSVTLNGNIMVSLFFLLGGKFGTNVFVIIGLYFLVDKKRFDSQKIVCLWLQTLFYLLILNLFDIVVFSSEISWKIWVKSFLPILGRSYWFASSYLILLLLLPILNRLYEKWNIRLAHVLVGMFIFSILPTVTFNGRLLGNSAFVKLVFKLLMFGPVWFSFLYMLIRYLKPRIKKLSGGVKLYGFLLFAGSYVLMFLVEIWMYQKGVQGNVFMRNNYSTIRDMSSFPCLTASFGLFLLFKNLHIPQNKWINQIASNTFGIYLLHNHETTIPIFWRGIFALDTMVKTKGYVPYSVALTIGIFIVGCAVEHIRKKMERLILNRPKLGVFCHKIDATINKRFYGT